MSRPLNTLANILSNTVRDEESGCLLYQGTLDKQGYAKVSYQGSMRLGSRVVFELFYGPIITGEVDHVCHVRRCVSPRHLRLLTHRDNVIHIKTYTDKRLRRLRTLLDVYPHVTECPVLLTAHELQNLWQCTTEPTKLLRTMSHAFPEDFHYERFTPGRGSKPAVYAIAVHESLIAKLPSEDTQQATAAQDRIAFVA
jgi:hypothetical protein